MLKLRIISALIAAPLVIAAIFLLPQVAFAAVFALLTGLALFEWGRLAGIAGTAAIGAYLVLGAVLALGLWFRPDVWPLLLAAVAGLWLVGFAVVLRFPASGRWLHGPALWCAGYAVTLAAWIALLVIRGEDGGAWLLVWLFVLVWGADIGAFFAGRAFGRRKLAPAVSPGKTWAGVAGGLLLAVTVCLAMALTLPALSQRNYSPGAWALGIVLLGGVSVFGDLFESALKRHRGVKDSGTLFPGHGGMLDRIDALLAALPFFALALVLV